MTDRDAREMGQEMTGGLGETGGAGTAGGTSTGPDEAPASAADEALDEPRGAGADESGLASGGLEQEEGSPT